MRSATGSRPPPTPHLDTLDGVYWYDALGRRVLKRSIQEDEELCDEAHVTCHDTIERFVWDGSQILAEVRATDASNAAAGGPAGPQTGRIVYVHPGGVDAPAGMVRNGVPYALHANWRGLYAFATDSLGRKAEESTVEWPANNRRAFLGRANTQEWSWFGSLVSSGTDASGLLYRRNRYYDPQSGQFTQQDPIGIAGGLNLYGFAGGDPVNNADPFGLCPWCALGNVIVDYTVARATGEEFGLGDAALSAAVGLIPVGAAVKGVKWGGKALLKFTRRNFRTNLKRVTGKSPASSVHAHHMFPQKFAIEFRKLGIDVNDPHFGAWWEAKGHLSNARRYNDQWDTFLEKGPRRREAMERMRDLAEEYKLTLTSGGR